MSFSKLGSSATGTSDGSSTSVATSAGKDVVAGKPLVIGVGYESASVNCNSISDGTNSFLKLGQTSHSTGGEPSVALFVCVEPKEVSSAIFTASFSANAAFKRIIVDQFDCFGRAKILDPTGSYTTGQGTASPYTTAAVVAPQNSLVWAFVKDFNGLSGIAATAPYVLGPTLSDTFNIYYTHTAPQQTTVPTATASSGPTRWVMAACVLGEVIEIGPPVYAPGIVDSMGIGYREMLSPRSWL